MKSFFVGGYRKYLLITFALLTSYFIFTRMIQNRNSVAQICAAKAYRLNDSDLKLLQSKSYFIAVLFRNSEKVLSAWMEEFPRLVQLLSNQDRSEQRSNIFISLHGSGIDKTSVYLEKFRNMFADLGIETDIQSDSDWDSFIRESNELHRIERLAWLRNTALRRFTSLASSSSSSSSHFDRILFLNDIFFCAEDILQLVLSSIQTKSDVSCGMDYYRQYKKRRILGFYDVWVARDMNGKRFTTSPPYAVTPASIDALAKGQTFQVRSCWNGAVSINAEVFSGQDSALFRSSRSGECEVSECELFMRDLVSRGRTHISIVPSCTTAYNIEDFEEMKRQMSFARIRNPTSGLTKALITWRDDRPIEWECCPMRRNDSYVNWDLCHMQTNWSQSIF